MIERRFPTGPRGLELSLCEWEGEGPPVLVLHGFLEQGAAWDAVAQRLGRRVIAPDHRGHGRSDAVGPGGWYHFWDYVGDVDAVVRSLDGPVDVVGHSMGGTIACLYAGSVPASVRRLALVEGLGPPDHDGNVVARARPDLADRRAPPRHPVMPDVSDAVARMVRFNPQLDPDVARRLAARTTAEVEGGLTWTWDALHRARAPVPFHAPWFREFLGEITAPVLLVDGASSPFRVSDRAERVAAIKAPTREVLVPGAGHLVHHDAPDALAAALRTFFEDSA